MKQFLLFNDEATARKRNREMMDMRRKVDNSDGDGKPYVTTERHVLQIAADGQAMLEIKDDSQLTPDEKQALVGIRPSKFELIEESGII